MVNAQAFRFVQITVIAFGRLHYLFLRTNSALIIHKALAGAVDRDLSTNPGRPVSNNLFCRLCLVVNQVPGSAWSCGPMSPAFANAGQLFHRILKRAGERTAFSYSTWGTQAVGALGHPNTKKHTHTATKDGACTTAAYAKDSSATTSPVKRKTNCKSYWYASSYDTSINSCCISSDDHNSRVAITRETELPPSHEIYREGLGSTCVRTHKQRRGTHTKCDTPTLGITC